MIEKIIKDIDILTTEFSEDEKKAIEIKNICLSHY